MNSAPIPVPVLRRLAVGLVAVTSGSLALGACQADPRYIDAPMYVEVGVPDSDVFLAFTWPSPSRVSRKCCGQKTNRCNP